MSIIRIAFYFILLVLLDFLALEIKNIYLYMKYKKNTGLIWIIINSKWMKMIIVGDTSKNYYISITSFLLF